MITVHYVGGCIDGHSETWAFTPGPEIIVPRSACWGLVSLKAHVYRVSQTTGGESCHALYMGTLKPSQI